MVHGNCHGYSLTVKVSPSLPCLELLESMRQLSREVATWNSEKACVTMLIDRLLHILTIREAWLAKPLCPTNVCRLVCSLQWCWHGSSARVPRSCYKAVLLQCSKFQTWLRLHASNLCSITVHCVWTHCSKQNHYPTTGLAVVRDQPWVPKLKHTELHRYDRWDTGSGNQWATTNIALTSQRNGAQQHVNNQQRYFSHSFLF